MSRGRDAGPGRLRGLPWALLRASRAGGGRSAGVLTVWTAWERLMLRLYRVTPVRPGGLLLYRVQRRRGREVILADGTVVRPGDALAELHIDNRRLAAMRGERGYATWRAVETLEEDLRLLGARLAEGRLGAVTALHGVSLLGSAGGRAGFEVRPLPHSASWALVRYFMVGIDAVYHPDGLRRLEGRARDRWPVEVWMSARRAAELVPGSRG